MTTLMHCHSFCSFADSDRLQLGVAHLASVAGHGDYLLVRTPSRVISPSRQFILAHGAFHGLSLNRGDNGRLIPGKAVEELQSFRWCGNALGQGRSGEAEGESESHCESGDFGGLICLHIILSFLRVLLAF